MPRSSRRAGRDARIRVGAVEVEGFARSELGPAVKLVLRPDALRLARPTGAHGTLSGQIVKATYVGRAIEYLVDTEAGRVFVIDRSTATPFEPAAAVELAILGRPVVLGGA